MVFWVGPGLCLDVTLGAGGIADAGPSTASIAKCAMDFAQDDNVCGWWRGTSNDKCKFRGPDGYRSLWLIGYEISFAAQFASLRMTGLLGMGGRFLASGGFVRGGRANAGPSAASIAKCAMHFAQDDNVVGVWREQARAGANTRYGWTHSSRWAAMNGARGVGGCVGKVLGLVICRGARRCGGSRRHSPGGRLFCIARGRPCWHSSLRRCRSAGSW
jgi:hypothetical protein